MRHPLARPHPATGKKAIYADAMPGRSKACPRTRAVQLLDYLIELRGPGALRLRHKWRRHDLVMWDNRCMFHAATDYDTAKELRVMYRTVVEGDATAARLRPRH